MKEKWIYRVGLGEGEISEEALKKSGLEYKKVVVEDIIKERIEETLGKPYKLNTSMREDAPDFFSCSSLISYLYTFAGLWMPSLSWEKYDYAKKIKKDELQFGDLIFTHHGRLLDKPVDHVGMYVGGGMVLAADGSSSKKMVHIEDLDESDSFKETVGYGRITDNIRENRFVIEIPEDRPDLRSKETLLKEIERYVS